jgi:hypothetical protein
MEHCVSQSVFHGWNALDLLMGLIKTDLKLDFFGNTLQIRISWGESQEWIFI